MNPCIFTAQSGWLYRHSAAICQISIPSPAQRIKKRPPGMHPCIFTARSGWICRPSAAICQISIPSPAQRLPLLRVHSAEIGPFSIGPRVQHGKTRRFIFGVDAGIICSYSEGGINHRSELIGPHKGIIGPMGPWARCPHTRPGPGSVWALGPNGTWAQCVQQALEPEPTSHWPCAEGSH